MKIKDDAARDFYLEEAAKSGWSSRQLDRQIKSFYYQRILASKDKNSVSAEIDTLEPKLEYEKIIKDPYVLEFLDLPANEHFYESELEQALIDHLQKFLLELGRGYSFVARQKHFNLDGRHFYTDLVFYNYILKCFVLIDLKIGDLTHQDIGQMQMYVNYYTRQMMNEGDNPPIGIVLCADKSDTLVEYTLPEDIYVTGIVTKYGTDGRPEGLCSAKKLYYVTTAGGPYNPGYSYEYIKDLAVNMFGITDTELIYVENLDIEGNDAEKLLQNGIASIENKFK